jgi:hypothetical protein
MTALLALLGLSGGSSPLFAQQQDNSQAQPQQQAESSSQAVEQQQDVNNPANTGQPAPGPVGGVEGYRLEGVNLGRSFLLPSFRFQELYDTNTTNAMTTSASHSDSVTALSGSLSLQFFKRRSTLDLDYQAGGFLYNTQTQSNAVTQQLGLIYKIGLRRWNILLGEHFSYLPDASFGLGGLGIAGGGVGLPGVGGGVTNFNPFFIPGQFIQTGNISRLVSSSVAQVLYTVGPRSSLDGTVILGFIDSPSSSLLNSRNITARFGYNRALSGKDTVVIGYSVSFFAFGGGNSGFKSHTFRFGYRRLITGRLLATAEGGPVISTFSAPTGMTTVPGGSPHVSWGLRSGLDYAIQRGSLNFTYGHRLNAGSGLLLGANADTFTLSASRDLSRLWTASLNGGFARSTSLSQTSGMTPSSSQAVFNNWIAGAGLSRPIGRYSHLQLRYSISRQTSNVTMCANNLACGSVALRQVVGVVFNWSTRPIAIQ